MDVITQLEAVVRTLSAAQWAAHLFQHPILWSEASRAALANHLSSVPQPRRTQLEALLKLATEIDTTLQESPSKYPFGAGPLEAIWVKLNNGEVGQTTAQHQAAELARRGLLHATYLRALSFRCVQQAYSGAASRALQLQGLILAAAQHCLSPDERVHASKLAAEYVRSAATLLMEAGDSRVYRQARQAADAALAQASDDRQRGELHLVLGILHLDPYAANRTDDWYRVGIREWLLLSREPDAPPLGAENGLPTPAVALDRAAQHLRLAAELSVGSNQRDALKALVQTLEMGRAVGCVPDVVDLVAVCDRALAVLEQYPSPEGAAYVRAVRERALGEVAKPNEAEPFDAEQYVQQLYAGQGQGAASTLASQAMLVAETEPKRALSLARASRQLFGADVADDIRTSMWKGELRAMMELSKRGAASAEEAKLFDAVAVALKARTGDEEARSLALLQHCDAEPQSEAVLWLTSVLESNLAVSRLDEGQLEPALQHDLRALSGFILLSLRGPVLQAIQRLRDLVPQLGGTSASVLAGELYAAAMQMEVLLGEAALSALEPLTHELLSRCLSERAPTIGVIWAMELAKGRRFRALLSATTLPNTQELNKAFGLLPEVFRHAQSDEPSHDNLSLDDGSLLTAFDIQGTDTAGLTADSRIDGLKRTFDARLQAARLSGLRVLSGDMTTPDSICKMLDPETVLIDLCYLTGNAPGTVALAYTREGVQAFVVEERSELRGAQITLQGDTHRAAVRVSDWMVSHARRAICSEPGPLEVDRKAKLYLEQGLRRLLGHGYEALQTWWDAGKRHLCWVPYGAYHFFPIHLLTWNGGPLADRWTITYLPNTALARGNPQAIARESKPAVLGLTYRDHPFLQPLLSSESEVVSIGRSSGSKPVLDAAVSRTAFFNALGTSRYVHLSCHGAHDPVAPELQHLFLAPDAKCDGRLFAYELADLALSHVALVSLSACETGLGRFDLGDNLRGLEANLFRSGVGAIVDTLWNASAAAAEVFFSTLYARLAAEASLRKAFREAQQATRETYPAYRDWGAFRLSGRT